MDSKQVIGIVTLAVLSFTIFSLNKPYQRPSMPKTTTFQVDGTLIHKFDVEQISETFSKRAIIVRVEHDQYPQEVKLEVVGPARNFVDNIPTGAAVVCHCELTGRSYTRKRDGKQDWFTSVKCYTIAQGGSGGVKPAQVEVPDGLPF